MGAVDLLASHGTLLAFAALAVVLATGALWMQRIRRVAVPKRRAGFLSAFGFGALLGVAALASHPGWLGGAVALVAVVTGAVMPLLRLGSRQLAARPTVRVGEAMRAFVAVDDEGRAFDSVVLAGRPYLLKFFRGHW